ncbi:DNA polymerase III subunit epsilon [Kordiimonas sediminis]|uniref:DNA polymerase III subunit epsilon n=1 Tax=Kordiimonas sediminis TaxID=1735581 RepID=A0A919ALC5_9PROT|nr:DNA polymerase III subunit epsilon [Kordiimonas sediminis]GHF15469.1 DNA polymerase III subunit epsilon [Kordiimonas sediminis]
MREILFDTETTGFDPMKGDRVIEIGCVEMVGKVLTGEHYHVYINPERDVPESAVKVHGLTTEFLSDKPVIAEVIDGFIDFVGSDSVLVAHNADFDMRFINWELENLGKPIIPQERFLDTLAIARNKFPGSPNSLDALCKRFGIENGHRTLHGALLDSEILADVYIELTGGRQAGFDLAVNAGPANSARQKKERAYRTFDVPENEKAAHEDFIKKLENPIWLT